MNVLITGASRGIGKAISIEFEKNGYDVYCPTRKELDLSSVNSVKSFAEKYSDEVFDTIVNNAGVNDINLFEDISNDELISMFDVNLLSPIKLLHCLIPNIRNSSCGRIVNLGSIWAVVSKEGRSIYSATKYGMYGITKTLALELAQYNVLVNIVNPGYTKTELTMKNNDDNELDLINSKIPLHRMASTDEIAKLVYFLGSDMNTYITGQQITIDGGYTIQ